MYLKLGLQICEVVGMVVVVEILGGPWRRLLRVEVKGEGEGCRKIVVG